MLRRDEPLIAASPVRPTRSVGGILAHIIEMQVAEATTAVNNMHDPADGRVTQLLIDWSSGDQRALGELMPLVYAELRRLADRQLRGERRNHTLQRTALVHEAYLRLINQRHVNWQSRAQFIGLAAQLMRRILIDHARGRRRAKRGGGMTPVSLDQTGVVLGSWDEEGPHVEAFELAEDPGVDLTAIDSLLSRLEALDPGQGRIVELRFFGGLSIEETAEVVGVSPATVKREWALARAWLRRELMTEASP
jgi:RNA polymerase sigma factor (TIGR02999 family)